MMTWKLLKPGNVRTHYYGRVCSVGTMLHGKVGERMASSSQHDADIFGAENKYNRGRDTMGFSTPLFYNNSNCSTSTKSGLHPQAPRLPTLVATAPTPLPFGLVSRRTLSSMAIPDDHDNNDTRVIPFLLADIGEGIAEVELLQWFVHQGDTVQQFDRICEVQSDKATVEITSRYDGRITSLEHDKGDMVKVGTALLYLEPSHDDEEQQHRSTSLHTLSDHDEKIHIPKVASQFHVPSDNMLHDENSFLDPGQPTSIRTTDTNGGRFSSSTKVMTSPAIRKLAMEHSLDLSTIVGTGPKRRVLKGDVLTVLKERGLVESSLSSSSSSSSSSSPEPPTKAQTTTTTRTSSSIHDDDTPTTTTSSRSSSPASYVAESLSKDDNSISSRPTSTNQNNHNKSSTTVSAKVTSMDEVKLPLEEDVALELRGYNRLMVQKMQASLQIPHMVYADEIDVTRLRTQYKHELPFLPYCIKALSQSLAKFPLLNSSYDAASNQVLLWADHNIGVAMDTPRGLIVPVIKQVQTKSIHEIALDLQRLKDSAKNNNSSVSPEDLQGATFTLSNIGVIGGGGTYMSPIVTSPQVAIGALGNIQRVPRFVAEDSMNVQEAYIVNVSWAGDHRVIDGATMARFHKEWKSYLQDPIRMIRSMK